MQTMQPYIYNDKKKIEPKEYEKKSDKRNSHINSKLPMICVTSNNDRHPINKTFTPLHYTWHITSSLLNFT